MRVFVTGATGFIGSAIVRELISSGHEVTGLARSADSAKRVEAAGGGVARGTIGSLDVLRREAGRADGVIHTAFFHALSHMAFATRLRVLLGGAPPSGIVGRFTAADHRRGDRCRIGRAGQVLVAEGGREAFRMVRPLHRHRQSGRESDHARGTWLGADRAGAPWRTWRPP